MNRQPVWHFRCQRCDRMIWSHEIQSECYRCMDQAVRVYGLGPLQGVGSGA
jgi:Zn finger protein HypA/HybF involved in hydrogenase expression